MTSRRKRRARRMNDKYKTQRRRTRWAVKRVRLAISKTNKRAKRRLRTRRLRAAKAARRNPRRRRNSSGVSRHRAEPKPVIVKWLGYSRLIYVDPPVNKASVRKEMSKSLGVQFFYAPFTWKRA